MFYHQYHVVFNEPINSLQINITLDNGVDPSVDSDLTWESNSTLLINDDANLNSDKFESILS